MEYPRGVGLSSSMAPVKHVALRTTLHGMPTAADSVLAVGIIIPDQLRIWIQSGEPRARIQGLTGIRVPALSRMSESYDPLLMTVVLSFHLEP